MQPLWTYDGKNIAFWNTFAFFLILQLKREIPNGRDEQRFLVSCLGISFGIKSFGIIKIASLNNFNLKAKNLTRLWFKKALNGQETVILENNFF